MKDIYFRDLERMSELDERLAPSASFLHNSCLLMTNLSELIQLIQFQSSEKNALSVKLHEVWTFYVYAKILTIFTVSVSHLPYAIK